MPSYLVLARKYRPKNFEEVVGQEIVTEVLRGALAGHVGHAYLFSGPRGTGKTTLARIFAKCLNCERGPTAKPCGECERCLAFDAGNEVDLIEMDAASHTGVDNIRELRDEVAYAPMRARFKVYLVDEVHMLSKPAFNALLKTLEEPPPHVVFLFATTEPHKVLDTILSRCQILRLSPLSEERIAARLEQVFQAEGVKAETGVALELARHARGGMRDALSQADKLLALAGNEPKLEDLHRLGGETGSRELEALLALIEAGDRPALLTRLQSVEGDEQEVLNGLLDQVRAAAVLAWCGEETPLVALTGQERSRAAERGKRLGAERLELWMQELLRARERLRLLPGQEHTVLELCLLDLLHGENTLPLSQLVQRLEALERRLAGAGEAPSAPRARALPPPTSASTPAPAPSRANAPAPVAAPARDPARAGTFEGFLAELARAHGALASMLGKHGPGIVEEQAGGRLVLRFGSLSEGDERLVRDKRNQNACAQAHAKVYGHPVEQVEVVIAGSVQRSVERPVAEHDVFTQRVAQDYGGTVEELP